jgi:hypothetical protein
LFEAVMFYFVFLPPPPHDVLTCHLNLNIASYFAEIGSRIKKIYIYTHYFRILVCINQVRIFYFILDDRGSRVRFPAGCGNFSFHHSVQNGPGAHPAYPMGTRGSFPEGKTAGAWSWPLTSI